MEVIIPAVIGSLAGASLLGSMFIYYCFPRIWTVYCGKKNNQDFLPEVVQVKNMNTGHLRIQIPRH